MKFADLFDSGKDSLQPPRMAAPPAAVYLSHFGLQEKPFDMAPDPRFLWLGRRLKRALLQLRYEILRQDGCVVITGGMGGGKTTLADALMKDLRKQAIPAKVSCPEGGPFDLFPLIASASGIRELFPDRSSFLAAFESFLRDSFSTGKKLVLCFDDAQRLTLEHLPDLANLSDLGENGTKWLNLVFVGQNEFHQSLKQESHRALRPRIIFNYHLPPFTQEETGEYILYRLRVARGPGEISGNPSPFAPGKREIFTLKALTEVFLFSRGIPCLINTICDSALLSAYAEGRKKVLPQTVKKCAQQLQLPAKITEWRRDESSLPPRVEGSAEGRIRGPLSAKPHPQRILKNPGKRAWVMISCGAAGFLVVFFAFIFLFPKEGSLLRHLFHPLSKEVSPTATAGTEGTKELIKMAVPSAGSRQPVFPDYPGSLLDSPAPQGEPNRPDEVGTAKKGGVRGTDPERQVSADSKIPAKSPKQASASSRREEKDFLSKGQEFLESGIAFSESKKGKINQSADPKATGVPETGRKEAEELEPGKVIEWFLEKKSSKKD
jgi:type II secretory pathway predicted ATPase ExeA